LIFRIDILDIGHKFSVDHDQFLDSESLDSSIILVNLDYAYALL